MLVRLGIIATTVILFYIRTMRFGYVIDDKALVLGKGMPHIKRSIWFYKDLWKNLTCQVFWVNWFEHGVTTLLHLANCITVYLFFGANEVSFWSAMLFAVNPSNNQGAIWLSGRGYCISVLMILIGLWNVYLFPLTYTLALFWCGSSIAAPILFLFYGPKWGVFFIPIALIVLWKKKFRKEILGRWVTASGDMIKLKPEKIILYFKNLGYYFFLALFPIRLGMYHKFMYHFGLRKEETEECYRVDKWFVIGVFLFYFIVNGAIFYPNGFTVCLFAFILFISQWCNVVTIQQSIAERYLYLPNAFLMTALSIVIMSFPQPFNYLIMIAVLCTYGTRLFYFLPAYRDNLDFFKSNVANFPELANAYNSLGAEYFINGKMGTALDVWMEGSKWRDKDTKLNLNMSSLLMGFGKWSDALKFLDFAEQGVVLKTQEEELIKDIQNKRKVCLEAIEKIKNGQTQTPPSATTTVVVSSGGGIKTVESAINMPKQETGVVTTTNP